MAKTRDLFDEARGPYFSDATNKWYYYTPEDGEVKCGSFEDAVNGWIQYNIEKEGEAQ